MSSTMIDEPKVGLEKGQLDAVPQVLTGNRLPSPKIEPKLDLQGDAIDLQSKQTSGSEEENDLVAPPKVAILLAVTLPPLTLIAGLTLAIVWGGMSPWFLALIFGGWIMTGLGITVGYHRLVAHRAFQTYPWIRAFWSAMGAMALEGDPVQWSALHRKHHKHSDCKGDPHTPHHEHHGLWSGLWFAHIGWMFQQDTSQQDIEKFAPDLKKDRIANFFAKTYLLWILLSLAIPTAIGYLIDPTVRGLLLGFCLGGGARIFWTHHITWSVNSICHVAGSKPYRSRDESRNNFLVGVLALGEGWHNNHHAFPTSARHGLRWWQFDLSWCVIRTLQGLGLAWKIQLPSERELASKSIEAK